jgi:hypothetical protein
VSVGSSSIPFNRFAPLRSPGRGLLGAPHPPPRSPGSLRSRPWPELGTAEAEVDEPVRGLVVVAARRARVLRVEDPLAAPDHAVG